MSFIPRLFLPLGSKTSKEISLDAAASRYLVKVLRLKEGDRFLGFDPESNQFELALKKADAQGALAGVLSVSETAKGKRRRRIALGQSLPKASKMDLILRQGTELGVDQFIPLITQRSISRPDGSQQGHKHERWEKILVEACRQCGRTDMPKLEGVADWKKGLEFFPGFDLVLLPYEKEAPGLGEVLKSAPLPQNILILIGPEGGWTPEEVREAQEKGALPVHLPTPILRTETAGLVVVSMIQFFLSQAIDSGERGN